MSQASNAGGHLTVPGPAGSVGQSALAALCMLTASLQRYSSKDDLGVYG